MLEVAVDRFTVSQTETTTTRKCPFCDSLVEDSLGKNINFVVHLGSLTREHTAKQSWADYVSFMNRI